MCGKVADVEVREVKQEPEVGMYFPKYNAVCKCGTTGPERKSKIEAIVSWNRRPRTKSTKAEQMQKVVDVTQDFESLVSGGFYRTGLSDGLSDDVSDLDDCEDYQSWVDER